MNSTTTLNINPAGIWFTSNKPPVEWYKDSVFGQVGRQAMLRRFNVVVEFKRNDPDVYPDDPVTLIEHKDECTCGIGAPAEADIKRILNQ